MSTKRSSSVGGGSYKKSKMTRQVSFRRDPYSSGVKSYNPLYKSMLYTNKRKFPIVQRININLPYTPSVGFSGTGYDLVLGLTQSGAIFSISNLSWNTSVFSNYTACTALFQEYRITRFEVSVYFSNNSANNAAGSTTGNALPILYAVEDREDDRSVNSAGAALQYASCKVMQMGDTKAHTKVVIAPSAFAGYDDTSSLVGTLATSGIKRSPWLACGSNSNTNVAPEIPHGYLKFFCDNCGNTNGTSSGTFTFVVSGVYEYRGID